VHLTKVHPPDGLAYERTLENAESVITGFYEKVKNVKADVAAVLVMNIEPFRQRC